MCDQTLARIRAAYDVLPSWPGSRAELVSRQIVVSPPAPQRHERIRDELRGQLGQIAPPDQAVGVLRVLQMSSGERYVPDLVLTRRDILDATPPIDAGHAILVVEVVLPVGNDQFRATKVAGFAASGVPACLLVDPQERSVTQWSKPMGDAYQRMHRVPFGAGMALPAPLHRTIDTVAFG